ncbi:hypothetical protein M1512_02185 [Patescibacteria group bacterium]|nr:hypothetical protein [Patescibacteria group bacterium]
MQPESPKIPEPVVKPVSPGRIKKKTELESSLIDAIEEHGEETKKLI